MAWTFAYSAAGLECANKMLAEAGIPPIQVRDPVVVTKVISYYKGASGNKKSDYVIDICDFDYFTH